VWPSGKAGSQRRSTHDVRAHTPHCSSVAPPDRRGPCESPLPRRERQTPTERDLCGARSAAVHVPRSRVAHRTRHGHAVPSRAGGERERNPCQRVRSMHHGCAACASAPRSCIVLQYHQPCMPDTWTCPLYKRRISACSRSDVCSVCPPRHVGSASIHALAALLLSSVPECAARRQWPPR